MCNLERILKNQKKECNCFNKSQEKKISTALFKWLLVTLKKMWAILKLIFQNRFSSCTDDLPNELADETGQTVSDTGNLRENLLLENFN
jgi:hypothetical protein